MFDPTGYVASLGLYIHWKQNTCLSMLATAWLWFLKALEYRPKVGLFLMKTQQIIAEVKAFQITKV